MHAPANPAAPPGRPHAWGQDSTGARIRLLRGQAGMTQHALARAIGVARSTIAFWETDRGGPRRDVLETMAAVLGTSVETFLTGMADMDSTETVTLDEAALLRLYRGCSLADRVALLRTVGRRNAASR